MRLWIEKELFQWEKDRYVNISSNNSEPEITFIQFYNEEDIVGPEVPLKNNRAKIPNYLLEKSLPIMAVACAGKEGETQVIERRKFRVLKRAKPDSYTGTDDLPSTPSLELAKLDADKDVSTAKHVVTGVTQVDGLITSIDETQLADVAFSSNIADLKEDADTYIVFNCGSSSVNI